MVVRWRTCSKVEVFGKVVMTKVLLGPTIRREKGWFAGRRKINRLLEE